MVVRLASLARVPAGADFVLDSGLFPSCCWYVAVRGGSPMIDMSDFSADLPCSFISSLNLMGWCSNMLDLCQGENWVEMKERWIKSSAPLKYVDTDMSQ
jgi:hypothetical protein